MDEAKGVDRTWEVPDDALRTTDPSVEWNHLTVESTIRSTATRDGSS